MAVGLAVDAGAGADRQYGGRITVFVALSCATAAMGGAIFGYDLGTSGGVSSMASFLKEFFPDVYRRMKGDVHVSNYCKFDSQLLTLFTSSLYIAGLLTALLLSSWFTARHGRRPSMILGGVAFLAGAAVSGGAVNVYMAILGRALLGVGLGFANQAVLLYLSEMAPARYRGSFSNGYQLTLCLGSLAANVINYGADKIAGGWGWRLSLGLAGVPAALFTLGAVFLPETPNSLVQQGADRDKVRALLQKIRGTDAATVDTELDDIVAAASTGAGGDSGLRLLLTRRWYWPQLAVAVLMPAFTQLNGINAIGFYAPVLLRTVGMGESLALLSTVITVVIYTASTVVFMLAVDRFPRRTLLIAGSLQMLASEVLIGAIMAAELGDEGGMGKGWAAAVRAHRLVRGRVQLVVGPHDVAGPHRGVPARGPVGGAERDGGVGVRVHHLRRAGVPRHALPDEGGALLLLRRVDRCHDRVCVLVPAGDEGDAHRAGRESVEGALVLEEGCGRR
ncbi:unnamed protein product [Urochloa humidicola]